MSDDSSIMTDCTYHKFCDRKTTLVDKDTNLLFASNNCQERYYNLKEEMKTQEIFNKDIFIELWYLHVCLTRQVIIWATLNKKEQLDKVVNELLDNQVDIGNQFKFNYGNLFGNIVIKLLKEHIVMAKEILDYSIKNEESLDEVYFTQKWRDNGNEIAIGLNSKLNPKNDYKIRNKLIEEMKHHLILTEKEIFYQVKGNTLESLEYYNEAIIHIEEMAKILISLMY